MAGAIGILALQGGFSAHAQVLGALGHPTRTVRTARDLEGLSGLVLPGGESTAMWTIMTRRAMTEPLATLWRSGRPVLATCAGLILAARAAADAGRPQAPVRAGFGWLDVDVVRNGYGRQRESFVHRGVEPTVFIRAPRITRIGAGVEVLQRRRGEAVAVRQGAVVGACHHPELMGSTFLHRVAFAAAARETAPRPP